MLLRYNKDTVESPDQRMHILCCRGLHINRRDTNFFSSFGSSIPNKSVQELWFFDYYSFKSKKVAIMKFKIKKIYGALMDFSFWLMHTADILVELTIK